MENKCNICVEDLIRFNTHRILADH